MAYIPDNFQASEVDIQNDINNLGDNVCEFDLLIKIDYCYYHQSNNYDGGLSFLDRINRKLGQFHPEWNIENMKNNIRNANDPCEEFIRTIDFMFSDIRDITYYGL